MTSKVGRMIQDQNLNIHTDGTRPGIKKEGRRKPLGDVSNTKASRKPAQLVIPKINSAASNKLGLSKPSGKLQINSSRKALADVSNTVKPLHKTSSLVAKESCCDFEEEGFLHDHKRCTEAMSEAAQMDKMEIFRMIHGPNPSILISSPSKDDQLTKFEEESLALEIPGNESSLLHFKYDFSVASPCSSPPLSPDRFTVLPRIWEVCDLQVMGSP